MLLARLAMPPCEAGYGNVEKRIGAYTPHGCRSWVHRLPSSPPLPQGIGPLAAFRWVSDQTSTTLPIRVAGCSPLA